MGVGIKWSEAFGVGGDVAELWFREVGLARWWGFHGLGTVEVGPSAAFGDWRLAFLDEELESDFV